MTELEAQRILAEHRTHYPAFVEGRTRYVVRPDGKVNLWKAVGTRGHRWASWMTVAGNTWWLPTRVRARADVEVKSGSENESVTTDPKRNERT